MLPVVILAGGLATRLRPITKSIPKSMVPVANKPFIEHQLNYLKNQGVKKIVICIGYLGQMIEDYVGNGDKWKLDIEYSSDGQSLLGTGGAIIKALPLLGNEFFILYGDSYLPIDFSEVMRAYKLNNKKGLMTIIKNGNKWDKSNVEFLDGQIIEYNKKNIRQNMNYIDYGLGILNANVFNAYLNSEFVDLSDVYNHLSLSRSLGAYEVFNRFYEIGTYQGLEEANHFFLTNCQ